MLPKFLRQIRTRQPVTITDREMTRYFMSIPEAVSLVLMGWVVGKSGQILLLDMGSPIKILELAETAKVKGLTLVVTSMYTKGRYIKAEVAVAKGKKLFDKRETIKKRETDRDLRRVAKER